MLNENYNSQSGFHLKGLKNIIWQLMTKYNHNSHFKDEAESAAELNSERLWSRPNLQQSRRPDQLQDDEKLD